MSVTDSVTYTVTNTNASGEGSLAHCLSLCYSAEQGVVPVIRFDESLAGQSIFLTSSLKISRAIKLINLAENPVVIEDFGLVAAADIHLENMVLPKLEVDSLDCTVTGVGNVFTGTNAVMSISNGCDLTGFEAVATQSSAYIGVKAGTISLAWKEPVNTILCPLGKDGLAQYELTQGVGHSVYTEPPVTLTVAAGATLYSSVSQYYPINEGATVVVEKGGTLTGYLRVGQGTLKLEQGARIAGNIEVEPGEEGALYHTSLINEGAIFDSTGKMVLLGWNGTTEALLNTLSPSSFEGDGPTLYLKSMTSDVTLSGHEAFNVHYLLWQEYSSDYVATLESGCSVAASYELGGTDCHLVCQEGSVVQGYYKVRNGGELTLNGARVEGELALNEGGKILGSGAVFAPSSYVTLTDWKGDTSVDLAGLANAVSEDGSFYVYIAYLTGSSTISGVPGCELRYSLRSDVAKETTLTVKKGATVYSTQHGVNDIWAVYGTLDFLSGSTLESGVHIGKGGVLKLNGACLAGQVVLHGNASLLGSGNSLAKDASLILKDWTGDTGISLSGLGNVTSQEEQLVVHLYSLKGETILRKIPEVNLRYQVVYGSGGLGAGRTLTVDKGVTLGLAPEFEEYDYYEYTVEGTLICEKNSVIEGQLIVKDGGRLILNGALVSGHQMKIRGAKSLERAPILCRGLRSMWIPGRKVWGSC